MELATYDGWREYTKPEAVTHKTHFIDLFKFVTKNTTCDPVNNLLVFKWLEIEDKDLADLKTKVPEIWDYENDDLACSAKIMSLLQQIPILTGGQHQLLNQAVEEIQPDQVRGVLKTYYPDQGTPDDAVPLFELFLKFARISEGTVEYLVNKCVKASAVVKEYEYCRKA